MIQYILYALLAWFLYKLIFGLIIPVYKVSRQMKKKIREMSARMNHSDGQEQMRKQAFDSKTETRPSPNSRSDDYIEFEEIRYK